MTGPSILWALLARFRTWIWTAIVHADAVAERLGLHGTRVKEVIDCPGYEHDRRKFLIYAHYNPSCRITRLVLALLEAYKAQGFNIVFVTSSKRITEFDLEAAKKVCAVIIRRRSYGRDFGAWKDGLRVAKHRFTHIEEILLTNDTILGPIHSLSPVFARMNEIDADFIGLTDSWDRAYHLQSFFLLVRGPRGVAALDDYLRRLFLRNEREWVIARGEVDITRAMLRRGLTIGVVHPYEGVRDYYCDRPELFRTFTESNRGVWEWAAREAHKMGTQLRSQAILQGESRSVDESGITSTVREDNLRLPGAVDEEFVGPVNAGIIEELIRSRLRTATLNPTHHFWRGLITRFEFPFIKVDLLAFNPSGIADLDKWRNVIREQGIMDPEIIRQHLQTLDIGRVP